VKLPDVLFQIKVPAKSFPAKMALERFLVVMRVHVERQVVDLVECLVAHVALVGFFPRVGELVVLVVSFLVEAFPTKLAHPRLVVLVYPDVGVESGRPVEGFATCVAFVWLFGGVDDLVATEGGGLAKPFATHLAYEGSGPRVHRHVSGEVVVGVEDLPAF